MAADDDDPMAAAVRLGPRNPVPPVAPDAEPADPMASAMRLTPSPLKTSYNRVPTAQSEGNIATRALDEVVKTVKHSWETRGQPVTDSEGRPIEKGEFLHGVHRGAADFLDTGAEGLATLASKIPLVRALVGDKVDVEGLRRTNKADRDAWEAEHGESGMASGGRLLGQIGATLPVLGGVGRLAARGAAAIPDALGAGARFVTSAIPATGAAARGTQLAVQGAGTGGLQAGLTSSAYDQPVAEQVAHGAAFGAAAGPVLGGLTKAVDVLRGYTNSVRPEIARLADQARALYGAHIPLLSMSSNPLLRNFADVGAKLPFSGADAANLAARRALQRGAAGEMGSTADNFGPAALTETRDRLRAGYNAALSRVPQITGGEPLSSDLATIGQEAARFTDDATTNFVGRAIRETVKQFRSGPFTGQAYKTFTASDGALARIEAAAPAAALPYIQRVRAALRDRLIASAPTGTAEELATLDRQYRAMKTVQPLAAKSATGDIALPQLQGRVISQSNKFDSSNTGKAFTGGGTLGEIGDIGKQFFGGLSDSGTAQRLAGFEFARHPIATTLAAIPGLAINTPLQAWLRRPAVQQRVINTSLGGWTPDIGRALPYGLLGPIDARRDRQDEGR